jgi:TPR repeat protein
LFVQWLEKACENNDADAFFWMGVAYQQGDGVEQDNEAAREWFLK